MRHDVAMKVTHTATFDAPRDTVYAMLTDPEFRHYVARTAGCTEVTVTVEPRGEGHVVTIDQMQPTEGVPAFARKFAGETTHAIQVETWESPTRGTISVKTPGRPSDVAGTYTLAEVEGRTVQTFEGDVTAKVPLIRDKLEKLIAELFLKGKEHDQRAGDAWLAGER